MSAWFNSTDEWSAKWQIEQLEMLCAIGVFTEMHNFFPLSPFLFWNDQVQFNSFIYLS